MVLPPSLRRLLRPALRPLVARLDRRWGPPFGEGAVRSLERRVDDLEGTARRLSEGAERQDREGASAAPLLLDVVATQHAGLRDAARREREVWAALERADRRIDDLGRHLDVVRREVLFELRYGRADAAKGPSVEPKVLNEEKLAAMGDELRLNVGSGSFSVEGYLNVDARAIDGVDVVAEVGDLPFDDRSVAEVRSSHVLEHFPEEELRRRVLPHWVAKLRPGGTLLAIVPDAVSMMEAWSKEAMTFEDLRQVTFGGQDYEGDFHFTMLSVASLTGLLVEAGLVDVEVVELGRRNGMCLEMELVARKPDDGRLAAPA